MDIGYAEKEVGRMYYGKWADLYFEWKRLHNIRVQRMYFKNAEEAKTLMDI